MTTAFARRVLVLLRRVPAGSVVTYGDLARLAGRPGAARAVGNIMRAATTPGLPYHRVIASGGRLGGYGGAETLKAGLLSAEGLTVRRGRVIDFQLRRWPKVSRRADGPSRHRPAVRATRGPSRPSK